MRSTHPFEQDEVMAYLDGEISADRASEIAQHMQQCAECRELAASFRNLSHELAVWEIEPSSARLSEQMHEQAATLADGRVKTGSTVLQLTPVQRLYGAISSWKQGRPAWALGGALVAILALAVGIPSLYRNAAFSSYVASRDGAPFAAKSRSAPGLTGNVGGRPPRPEQLEEYKKWIAQQQISSSLENQSPAQRYSVSIEPGDAAPAPPIAPSAKTVASLEAAPMIARTASLALVVKNFEGIESAVKAVVSRHSGYIGELSTSAPPDAAKTFSATLRVPSAQLEPVLAELKQLGRADQESQAGEEVTKQYVDLAARLKNSRATEDRLLGVLHNNTGKVKDVLEVENEISRVRGEIEEMAAEQRTLQARIDFATITLSVGEEYKASLNAGSSSTGTRLHNAFVTGFHSLTENVIGLAAWFLESGPTLLLWIAILFFPVRWAWRRVRRALAPTPKPAAA